MRAFPKVCRLCKNLSRKYIWVWRQCVPTHGETQRLPWVGWEKGQGTWKLLNRSYLYVQESTLCLCMWVCECVCVWPYLPYLTVSALHTDVLSRDLSPSLGLLHHGFSIHQTKTVQVADCSEQERIFTIVYACYDCILNNYWFIPTGLDV